MGIMGVTEENVVVGDQKNGDVVVSCAISLTQPSTEDSQAAVFALQLQRNAQDTMIELLHSQVLCCLLLLRNNVCCLLSACTDHACVYGICTCGPTCACFRMGCDLHLVVRHLWRGRKRV